MTNLNKYWPLLLLRTRDLRTTSSYRIPISLDLTCSTGYLHPGVDVHQSSSGDGLHDAVVVADHFLQLCVAVAIGAAEHQRAHHVSHSPGDGSRRIEASGAVGHQLGAQTVNGRKHCQRKRVFVKMLMNILTETTEENPQLKYLEYR